MSATRIQSDQLARIDAHYSHCLLCEHRCGTDRLAGGRGRCKAGATARVFRHRVEHGEEPELVPSHLFYLSGCDLRCAFCIAERNAFDPRIGTELTAAFFQAAVAWGRVRGARNIQWVGGEPTIHLPAVMHAMADFADMPPVVWKSDFYGTPEAFDLLGGVVDIFVADFKFGNDLCAERIAKVPRYVETLRRNLLIASQQGDLIVRHLLLPGHFECCYRPIVAWLSEILPQVKFSIREGYLPRWQAHQHSDLSRRIEPDAGGRARLLALEHDLRVVG